MNTPESSDKESFDFAMSDFEKQLKSLTPRESTVHRDDLLFRAGYEAALAAVSRGATNGDAASCRVKEQTSSKEDIVVIEPRRMQLSPWMQSVAVAMLLLIGAICGVVGWQIGERQTVARYEAIPNLMNQLNTTGRRAIKPSTSKSGGKIEPLPPVYATDDDLRSLFASSNEPNYIELRDQVLRFGVDVMPESYSFAMPAKSSKERKPITPLSYGAVELSAERY